MGLAARLLDLASLCAGLALKIAPVVQYYGYSRWGTRGGMGIVGLVILIVFLLWLFGGGGFH